MKFLRILPHRPVDDLEAEVAFYCALGLHVYLRFDGFISVRPTMERWCISVFAGPRRILSPRASNGSLKSTT